MSGYRLVFARTAEKDIRKLDRITKQRLAKKLQYFSAQPRPMALAKPLIHSKLGSHRFRIGHYRVIFDISGKDINILAIKHRREVYK